MKNNVYVVDVKNTRYWISNINLAREISDRSKELYDKYSQDFEIEDYSEYFSDFSMYVFSEVEYDKKIIEILEKEFNIVVIEDEENEQVKEFLNQKYTLIFLDSERDTIQTLEELKLNLQKNIDDVHILVKFDEYLTLVDSTTVYLDLPNFYKIKEEFGFSGISEDKYVMTKQNKIDDLINYLEKNKEIFEKGLIFEYF